MEVLNILKNMLNMDYKKSRLFTLVFGLILLVCPLTSYSLPEGENVVSGKATFDRSQVNTLNINTPSDKLIVNYNSFSIAQPEAVHFYQPSSSSVALNRVVGTDPSTILGRLTANGRLFLVNPNGILFGQTARVDVAGLVASTLDISNDDFLAGRYNFNLKPGFAPSYVVNRGSIKVDDNGFVVLASPLVSNQGEIIAHGADVVIAGTSSFSMSFDEQGLINFVIPRMDSKPGTVTIPKEEAFSLIEEVVNTEGIVEAARIVEEDGMIKLVGTSGLSINSGVVNVEGTSSADAGSILVDSTQGTVLTEGTHLSASGGESSSGGEIKILSGGNTFVFPGVLLEAKGGDFGGDGGFIEVSGDKKVILESGEFYLSAPNGSAGRLLIDPDELIVSSSIYSDGADTTLQADEKITVYSRKTISTRNVGDGAGPRLDHLTASSVGDSGNLTMEAPEIEIRHGVKLLTFADNGYAGGDITIEAEDTAGLRDTTAKITLGDNQGGVILKGEDISIRAIADTSSFFGDAEAEEDDRNGVERTIDTLSGVRTFAGWSTAGADAEVFILSGTDIEAENLNLEARAKAYAEVKCFSTALGVAYGFSKPTAKVIIEGSSDIKADGDIVVHSLADSKVDVTAYTVSLGTELGTQADVTVAIGESDIEATSKVDPEVKIETGGTLTVKAEAKRYQSVSASGGAYQDGTVGVGVAISKSESDVVASVGGEVNATGDINIEAISETTKNDTSASSQVGTGFVADKFFKAGKYVYGEVKNYFSSKKPSLDSRSSSRSLNLSASFAYVDHTTNATSSISDSATVSSQNGGLKVNSYIYDMPEVSAKSFIDSNNINKKENSVSTAVAVSHFTNNATSFIGKNAIVNAYKTLSVTSRTRLPYEIQWFQFKKFADVTDKLNSNFGIQNGFFTSWVQSNSQGEVVGAAGTVNVIDMQNTSRAYIDEGVQINQNPDYRSSQQNVEVVARSEIDTVNLSGVFGFKLFGGQGRKTGVGGAYLGVNSNNATESLIKKGVKLYGDSLFVNADSRTNTFAIAESGSKADTFALAGTFSLLQSNNTTLAQIDDGAEITTGGGTVSIPKDIRQIFGNDNWITAFNDMTFEYIPFSLDTTGDGTLTTDDEHIAGSDSEFYFTDLNVFINSQDDSKLFNVAGGIVKSKNVGIGASISINEIQSNTQALVGNREGESDDLGSLISQGKMKLAALNRGAIDSWSLASTVTTSLPTDAPSPPSPADAPQGAGKYGIAISGDVSINDIDDSALAYISDADIEGISPLELSAENDTNINAVAGSATISTQSSGLAGSYTDNDIDNVAKAYIKNSKVSLQEADLNLDADTKGEIKTIAAGGSGAPRGIDGAGSVSLNTINNITQTFIDGSDFSTEDINNVSLNSQDTSTIESIAGTLSYGGYSGIGAGVGINTVNNQINSYIKDSALSAGGHIEILAKAENTIRAVSAALAASPEMATAMAVSINRITSQITSYIEGEHTSGDVGGEAGVSLFSEDNSDIFSIAGELSAGNLGVGASVSYNEISNSIFSYIKDVEVTSNQGNIEVKSDSSGKIETVSAGGAGAGSGAIAGSVVINCIENEISSYIDNSSVEAYGSLGLLSTWDNTMNVYGGTLSGGGSLGIGASATVSILRNKVKAYIKDSQVNTGAHQIIEVPKADGSSDTENIKGVAVIATSKEDLDLWTANASGAGKAAIAANTAVTIIEDETKSYISNSSVNQEISGADSSQVVKVKGWNSTDVDVKAGGLAFGGAAGFGETSNIILIGNTTKAYINPSTITAEKDIEVASRTLERVNAITVSGEGGGKAGVAGAVAVIDLSNINEAYIEGSTVNSWGDLKIIADDEVYLGTEADGDKQGILVGSLSIGGVAGVGGSVLVTSIGNSTTSRITDSTTNAKGITQVEATGKEDVLTYAASGDLGGYVGIGGAVSVNTIETTTRAYINEVSAQAKVNQNENYSFLDQDVELKAEDSAKIENRNANVDAAGVVGAGASINVSSIKNEVMASIGSGTEVSAGGKISVEAVSDKSVDSIVISAGAGTVGIQGAVAIVNIGAPITEKGTEASENKNGSQSSDEEINDQLTGTSGSKVGDQLGDTDTALNTKNEADSKTSNLSVSEEFDTNAIVDKSTTAFIGDNSIINSQGDINLNATNTTQVKLISGATALGVVGIDGAVAIANINDNTTTYIGQGSKITTGGDIRLDASSTLSDTDVDSYAGGAGVVSLGAAVSYLLSDNDVSSFIGAGTTINNAEDIEILAENSSDIDAESFGANAGAAAIGVSWAEAKEQGDTLASLGDNTVIGDDDDSDKNINNLTIKAEANQTVNATSRAASAGILSGRGSIANTEINSQITAFIGKEAHLNVEENVAVQSMGHTSMEASALGVGGGGIDVGISDADAKTDIDISAYIDDNSNVSAGGDVEVKSFYNYDTAGKPEDKKVNATSESSTGSLLGGVGASSYAETKPTVHAYLNNNTKITAGKNISIVAKSNNTTEALSTGRAFAMIAGGSTDSKTSSTTETLAYLNEGVEIEGEQLIINAEGNDNSYAETNSGAGSFVSGTAASAETEVSNVTKSYINDGNNKTIKTNTVEIMAANTLKFNSKADSFQASILGGSGASSSNNVVSTVETNIGADVHIETEDFVINATNTIDKDWLPDGEYNIDAGAGGAFEGAAADSKTNIEVHTKINIGNGAQIQVTGDPFEPGRFEVTANNDIKAYDRVKLDTGGAIVVALAKSEVSAKPIEATLNIGDNAFLKSVGDINMCVRSDADIKAQANTSTYGLASAGQGKSKALAEAEDSITVGENAEVIATKEFYFLAGADMNGLGVLEVKANTDVFNKTAFAYSGSPDADATARHFSTIETKQGSHLASGRHMTIEADKGFLFANGNGKATDASRKALEKLAELFGADAEGAFDTVAGTSVNEGTGALVLNGRLETGIYRKLYLTFGKDVFNPYYKTEDGSKGRHTIAFDEEDTGKWWVYVYNADQDIWERSWELIPDEQSEGISWTILTDQRIADNIQAEIERLENVKKQYGANSELAQDIDSRLTILRAQLEAQKSGEYTDIIRVDPAYAASGNVNLWADYVIGSGSISAPGDVEIRITNNSPLPLKLDTLTIPDEMGGQIRFNNRRVRSSSDIENANKDAPAGAQVSLSLADALNSPPPVIEAKNTFDKDSGVYNPENIPDMADPALFVSGEINNLNGLVRIDNDTGSIIATAGIRANTIELSAGGDFIFDSPDTLYNTGPHPAAAFKYIAEAYENDYLFKPAYHGQEPSNSFQIAGNNLYINADTVNINGVIQSGLPDKIITITQDDVNAGYNKANASGERFVKIVEVNEQLDGRRVVTGGISAELDTKNNQITILGTEIQGGKVFISGRIVSTGDGKINVIDGYGRIVIDNQTNLPVVLKKIDTAGVEGKVVLIDKAKDNGTGLALVTKYERIGNEIRVYTNEGIESSLATELIFTSSGRDTIYQPLENMRYFWMTGKATSSQIIKKWYKEHDKFLGFIPVSERHFSEKDYVSGYPKTRILSGDELPQGDFVGEKEANDYTYQRITEVTENKLVRQDDSEGTYWYWHPGSWWHPPYPAKKTWWRRTQIWDKGENTYNYHSVKADCPINISFIGYDQGEVNINSLGNILINGAIHNEGGITTLTSTSGNLINATSVGSIQSARINLTAAGTIGSESNYLRITHSRGNILNAIAGGDIYLESASGDLMVTTLSTDNGSVGLLADQNLLLSDSVSLIKGKNISLEARRGAIGTSDNIIRIDTDSESCGKVRIVAHNGDVNVVEISGDLYIDQIEAQGDVTLVVPGDVIDANTNEKKDTRTREELLALWDDMMLTGSAAEEKKEAQWEAYRRSQDEAYQNYWRNKRNLRRDENGDYTYDPYDADVTFSYTQEERNSLKDAGWSEEDIRKEEEKMTQRYRKWGQSDYDPDFSYVLSDEEKDDLSSGYFWTEKELEDSLPSFVETHDTTLSIEEPNIIGRNVTITAGGRIGSDKEDIFYYYSNPDMYSEQEKEDIKVAIAAAERDDLEWKEEEKLLIIHQREDVDIHASGSTTLTATGHIFLGGEEDVNLYAINSGGRIRIKVGGSIYNPRADMNNNIVGSDSLILEASDGAIGSSGFPIRITLQGNTPYVTARASGDIYLTETTGDFYIDLVNTDGDVELISQQGGIYDWLEDLNTDIYADNINIRALMDIGRGSDNNKALDIEIPDANGQLILDTTSGGANIFSIRDVNLGSSNIYGTFRLESMGAIEVQGDVSAGGDISFVSGGDITFGAALIATNNTVDLNPSGNNILDNNDNSYLWAESLVINDATNIGCLGDNQELDINVNTLNITNTSGSGYIRELTDIALNLLELGEDFILTAGGNVGIDTVTAGGGISLTSTGAVIDINGSANNITADNLIIVSSSGIGSNGVLETTVNNLDAVNTNNAIRIVNSGKLNLIDLNGDGYSVNNLNGKIEILASSPLNVNSAVSSGTDITLQATEDGEDDDHLTISANVISAGGGLIALNSGTDFLQTAGMIATAGNVDINADYDGSGKGSIIQSGGSITATTLFTDASEDIILTQADNDVVNLDASSTLSGDIDYRDKNAINLIDVDTANGAITVNAKGKITATDVDSSVTDNGINNISLTSATAGIQAIWIDAGTKNDVFLTARQGSITQDGVPACDVTADELHIDAQKGIDLDTRSNILVADNSQRGDIVIDNTGDLYAKHVDNKGGDIRITTHSDLFVGDIQAQGSNDVYLNAATGSIWDDLFADANDLNYIRGDLVDLVALEDIGDMAVSNGDIDVRANTINASCGGDLILEAKDGTLFNNISAGGRMSLTACGSIILGNITSDGFIDIRVSQGDITVTTDTITSYNSGVRLTTDTGSIYAQGPGPHIIAADDSFLNAPNGRISPLPGVPLNVSIKGGLYLDIANLSITYPTRENYGNLIGTITPLNTPILIPTRFPEPLNPPGFVYFNAKQIWPPKSNADYQWLAQQVVTRHKPFIARYRHKFYNNPRYLQEAVRVRGDYFESLEGFRFVSIEPATPLLYAYHPLIPVDASAFEQIALDIDAYEFIENRIDLKGDLSPYLLYPEEEKEKKGESI